MRHCGLIPRAPLFLMPLLLLSLLATPATISVEGFDSAAIAAAINQSQHGDVVLLPAGAYEITEAIAPKSNTKLTGAGQGKTLVRFVGDKPSVIIGLRNCEDIEVCNLALDGASSPNVYQGIAASNAKRLNIHHVTIRNLVKTKSFGPHGIHFNGQAKTRKNGVLDSVIADCAIENVGVDSKWGAGIRISWGSCRNQVLRCTIEDTGRGGILTDNGSTDLVIRGNTVTGSGGTALGIEVWGGCDRCVIEDNHIDHWLSIGGCDWCAARRNVVSAKNDTYAGYGLEVIGSHLIVTDNLVDDGQLIGISVSSKQPKEYHFYRDNTIKSCTQWGSQFQGEAGGIAYHYLYRCKFLGTTFGRGRMSYPKYAGHGFRTNSHCKHMVLEECEMVGNARYGVQLGHGDVDALSFIRCVIKDNGGPAVTDLGEYSALEWTDCVVEGNASDKLPPAKPFAAPAPTAAFEMPAEAQVGQPVRLVSKSKAAEGGIKKAMWDLDDGPPMVGDEVTHTYQRPGTYRVTLVVWDEAGRGARAEKELSVR